MDFGESNILFQFDDRHWHIVKFDMHKDYHKISNAISETKAIDFLGILREEKVVMLEIKSFRNHRIENKDRLETGANFLTTEIAQKVRDSIAAIVGASRNSTNDLPFWKKTSALLQNSERDIFVIAWVEEDIVPIYKSKLAKSKTSVNVSLLKNKLKWLTPFVLVCNTKHPPLIEGLSVSFLPGA